MIVVALDGVLRTHSGTPIADGIWLLNVLRLAGERVVIASDGPMADAKRWLRANNQDTKDEILGVEAGIADVDLRLHQVRTLRARGGHITLVVDPDPHRAIKIMAEGLTVAVFAHPRHTRPDRRFSRPKATAWSRIVESLNTRHGVPTRDSDEGLQ